MSTAVHPEAAAAAAAPCDKKIVGQGQPVRNDRSTTYAMLPNRGRGKFIIINNKTFDKATRAPEHHGTDRDAKKLESVLRDLGFIERHNVTGRGMVELMEEGESGRPRVACC